MQSLYLKFSKYILIQYQITNKQIYHFYQKLAISTYYLILFIITQIINLIQTIYLII